MLDVNRAEAMLSLQLGAPLALSMSTKPLCPTRLRDGERAVFETLHLPARRNDWLRGRRSLKELLARLGRGDDTSTLRFPSAEFSLTHTQTLAVAVASTQDEALGIGIDVELERPARRDMLRFFLSPREIRDVEALQPDEWLRLWTVKEAVYKADLANRERCLGDYGVDAPRAWTGTARKSDTQHTYCYACVRFQNVSLCVALAIRGDRA